MILIKLSNLLLGARQHHTTSGSVLFLLWPLTDGKFANLGTMKKHTLTSCSSISPPMRRSIQSARGTQIIRGGQTSRLPGGQEVEDRFAPWNRYPLSGHWRRPQLLRSTFRSAPESCPCCVSPTMRCGRLPSRSDVNILTLYNSLRFFPILSNSFHVFLQFFSILSIFSYNSFQFVSKLFNSFHFFLTILFNPFHFFNSFQFFPFFLQFFSILFKPFQFFPFFLAIRSNSFQFFCQFQRIVQK